MATLLAGAEALQAALALARKGPLLSAHSHPAIDNRNLPAELLALAQADEAILIDVPRTPELKAMLQDLPLLGSLQGQRLGHALASAFGALPGRIACAQNSHVLLQADVCQIQALPDLLTRYGCPQPPAATGALHTFALEAQSIAQVLQAQAQQLKQQGLTAVSRIEAAALGPIVAMERHGMPVDRKLLAACLAQENIELGQLAQTLAQKMGAHITADMADDALLRALDEAGHPLPTLGAAHQRTLPAPLGEPLLRFTALRRLGQTVGTKFARHIGTDGRIHSHFVQIGARSGRMACTRPNLQAITSDPLRRACFRAPQGYLLIIGDYAACELRILADMSQDEALGAAIGRGADLHAAIASSMFGVEVSKTVRPTMRQAAKTIAFGLIYGMGTKALAAALSTEPHQAAQLMEQFFAAFPKVRPHLTEHSAHALKQGYAVTLGGRRCALTESSHGRNQAALLRLARNLPIQGTSADITKVALARAHQALKATPKRAIVHCIHDEIVLMCPTEEADHACGQLKQAMEGAGVGLLQRTRLVADVRARQDWQAH